MTTTSELLFKLCDCLDSAIKAGGPRQNPELVLLTLQVELRALAERERALEALKGVE